MVSLCYTAPSDLQDVVGAIRQYSDWRNLGSELGLDHQTLETIQEKACKKEMLESWLVGKDKVIQCGGPTWQQLADCLRQLGQDPLAKTIDQEFVRK